MFFPGASARQKRWPATRFAQLARLLHQRYGSALRLVVAGSPDDNAHARKIIAELGQATGALALVNLCARTSLPELAAVLQGARLLVSNDTVAAHLAVQVGTPCITVLMGENYGKFFPYPAALHSALSRCLFPPSMEIRLRQGNKARPDFTPKIEEIEAARVLAEVEDILKA